MTPPHFDTVRDRPLLTDDDVLERVAAIVGRARRRRLWLMFLDEFGCQLPLLVPLGLPRRAPHPYDAGAIAGVLARGASAVDPAGVVIALERGRGMRRGRLEAPDASERGWLALTLTVLRELDICRLGDDCPGPAERHGEPLALRGPVLVTRAGARWIAPDDLIADLARFETMFQN